MKKSILSLLACIFMLGAITTETKAQVSINLNIGNWNPPAEYSDASYYYLPDVNSYYYVPTHQYIYLSGGNWVWRNTLPPQYRYYNINDGYKVAMYRPRPYRYYADDRVRYARYKGVKNVIVRDNYYTTVIKPGRGPKDKWRGGPEFKPGRGPKGGFGPGRGNGPGGPPGHDRGHGHGHGHGHDD